MISSGPRVKRQESLNKHIRYVHVVLKVGHIMINSGQNMVKRPFKNTTNWFRLMRIKRIAEGPKESTLLGNFIMLPVGVKNFFVYFKWSL